MQIAAGSQLIARKPHNVFALICTLILSQIHVCAVVFSAGNVPDENSIRIQYRELIDDSTYGHSGLPAYEIFEQLALSSPEGIAKKLLYDELLERWSELLSEIGEMEDTDDSTLLKQKQAEFERIGAILEDDALLEKEVDSYIAENEFMVGLYASAAEANISGLLADVEPVCEPVAFVLNDALAQKDPATLNPDLVELAAFYPRGESEPGWADMIRTRRFVIYTDGGSYCRLFLPGASAEKAWDSAFPVIRHTLLSLFKPESHEEVMTVDVYSYQNDIVKTTFTLNLAKQSFKVTANDLGTPSGLRPLDLVAFEQFFADGLTLEGCGVDATGQLVLIGSKGEKPTLEGHQIELADLAVAYRASAYAGHGESYMSLDKAEDDDFVNVNFGGRLYDTRMGWVAYRCDLRFKTLGDDFDAVSFEALGRKISDKMPDYASQQERFFSNESFRNISSEGTRFWFYPDDFKIVTAADGKSCLVSRPRFTAAAERQESYDAEGREMGSETPLWTSLTLEHFNNNYNKFAQLFPEVAELDHAARLLGVAEWLHQAKVKGDLSLDLDELLTVSLPVSPTPRNREQLQIHYAVNKVAFPAVYKAYCISSPIGAAEFNREVELYEKPESEWEVYSVIAGGLDFSARNAVKRAATASEAEQLILQKSMVSKKPFIVSDGKELKTSSAFDGKGPPKPPSNGFVVASVPEPEPRGIGFDGLTSKFKRDGGGELDGFIVQSSGVKRIQKSDAQMFYKEGSLHSVWVSEHGAPDRFAMNTTKGTITYRLSEQNGVMTANLVSESRVPSEGELDFLASVLTEKKSSISRVWNMAPVDAEIRAIDMTPSKEVLIYYMDEGADVLRIYKEGAKPSLLKGEGAMARLHEASREKVRTFSVPGKVELLFAATEGENVVLQIGRREPIRISKSEWGDWLGENGESAIPEALGAVYNDLIKSDAELIVMRDALQSRPQRLKSKRLSFVDEVEELEGVEPGVLKMSDGELQAAIAEIKNVEEGASVIEAFLLEVQREELEAVQRMSIAEKAEAVSAWELERKEELADFIVRETQQDAVALAGLLKNKLQEVRVSYDDPSPLVSERVLNEPLVKGVLDVGLAIPPGEAGVDDKGILRQIRGNFLQCGIPLIEKPADLSKVGNVILVTAHNNEALFDYIQSLGEYQINGKSALDGKFLMLTTCFEHGNPNMVSELLRRYNCAGVHVQSEKVNKDAVRRALVEFGKALRDVKPDAPAERLRDIFDESVRRVLQSNDPGVDSLKKELEKLLRARVQWCALPRPGPKSHVVEIVS